MSARPALFGTVPSHDYLQFWQSGRFQPQRVVRFLGLAKEDVARIAGLAVSSVRFDRKAPRDLTERLTDVAVTCTLVAESFAGNATRTGLWFKAVNPMLGEISPRDMIREGRHEQLRRLVLEALAESPLPRAEPPAGTELAGARRG